MRSLLAVLLLLFTWLGSFSAVRPQGPVPAPRHNGARSAWGRVPLQFERSADRSGKSPEFLTRGSGYLVGLSAAEARLVLRGGTRLRKAGTDCAATEVRLRLVGADPAANGVGESKLPGRVNYFRGRDPRGWQIDVPTYRSVRYQAVYPGVDLVYYGNQQQLEYDFVVQPGADAGQIRLRIGSGERLRLSPEGDLLIRTATGTLRQMRPVVYQERGGVRRPVTGAYRLAANDLVSFAVGPYDRSLPLVIDPVLTYSSYLGGSLADQALNVAVDAEGNCYVCGYTASANFPGQSGLQDYSDAFVVKLDATGTGIDYATFLGGSGSETASGIRVNSAGEVYLAGFTSSPDFPVMTPLQSAYQGQNDGFVAKLGPLGKSLVYSTYLGGGDQDAAIDVAVDAAGSTYVVGATQSGDFPAHNPFSLPQTYAERGFISKLTPSGSALVYSSQLGETSGSKTWAVDVDADGNAYIGGVATANFPWVNPINAPNPTLGTAFVAQVNASGTGFGYATPLRGCSAVLDLKVDAGGSVYYVGSCEVGGFATPGAYQTVLRGPKDGFVSRISAGGTAILFSTYLGGSGIDELNSIDLDAEGNAYVTGGSTSADFPLEAPLQNTNFGGAEGDLIVSKLSPTGTALSFSTYLGAAGSDVGSGIAADASGNVYVVGSTSSFAFPTFRAVQPTYGSGALDAFVLKIGVVLPPELPTLLTATATRQTTVQLSWLDQSDNETAFQIERKPGTAASVASYERIGQSAADQPAFIDAGLTAETTYTYRVRAVNAGGPSVYSGPVTVTTLPLPPAPPTDLTVQTVSQTQLDLRWTDASDNETQFEIERSQGTGEYQLIAQVDAGVTSFSDNGLAADATYTYRVRAVNSGGASAYSAGAAATTLPFPPTAPGDLTVRAVSATQLHLDWTDHSDNETGFEVDLRISDGSYQLTAVVPANEVSVVLSGIQGNGARVYRVRAVNAGGTSEYSNIASGLTFPVAPTAVTLNRASPGRLDLHWTDRNEVDSAVRIERRLQSGEFDFAVTIGAGINTYADLGLAPDTEYTYRLRGINATGASVEFEEVTGRTLPDPPAAPSALTVTAGSSTQLNLHWTDNSSNETKFEVYRQVGGGAFQLIATLGADAVTFVDSGRQPNSVSTYQVRAGNEGGVSDYTAAQGGLTLPAPPANLQLQVGVRGRVEVHWTDQNVTAVAHRIERRMDGETFASLATVAAGTTAFTDASVTPGGIVFYRVWATNASGNSESSIEGQVSLPGGKLQVSPTANFGKAPIGAVATRNLTLKNTSRTESLRITVGQPAAPYRLSVGGGTFTLAPGGKHTLSLVFQPTVRGQAKGTLEFASSMARKPLIRVRLTGVGK